MVPHLSTGQGRRLVPVILAMVLAMTAGTAIGGHFASAVKSYTGCLNAGTIVQVAEGNAPAKKCASGHVEVHFSGGDITAITAGTGLVGGADNGAATLALGPGYQLPQHCATAQVAKWNGTVWECAVDDTTAYTVGTGLELNGTELSLDDDYRLPQDCERGEAVARVPGLSAGLDAWGCAQYAQASETCPAGQFAHATSSIGELVCAAPGAGASKRTAVASLDDGPGIPSDVIRRAVFRLELPAGRWAVEGKVTVISDSNHDLSALCELGLVAPGAVPVLGTGIDFGGAIRGGTNDEGSKSFMALVENNEVRDVVITCWTNQPGQSAEFLRIFAFEL